MLEFFALTSTAALLAFSTPAGEGAHDWTGAFAGINIATPTHGRNRWFDADGDVVNLRKSFSGLQGNALIGYNHQWRRLVLGAEAELGLGRFTSNAQTDLAPNCVDGCNTRFSTMGAARVRIGYAFRNTLPYAHAGLTMGRTTAQQVGDFPGSPAFDITRTAQGHTWGYGVEHVMRDGMSVRFHYSHYVYNPIRDDDGTNRVRSRFGTMSIGVNYHF